jgi:hypothetical protein
MWSSDDEGDEDIGDSRRDLSKVDLVNGLIKAVSAAQGKASDHQRKQVAALESPSLQTSTSDLPRTPRESGSSSLTSPPSSSGDSQLIKDMEAEATPKAPARGKSRQRPQPGTANRKDRKLKTTIRPKGAGRRDIRKARFDNTVKSPEQKMTRLRRTRSSTVSSQYATTSDGSNNPSHEVDLRKPRHPPRRPVPTSGVERTPIIRRLRPRAHGSASSNGSTEVDADQEDNADDEPVSASSSRQLRRADSTSTRETRDRRAKREALRTMQPDDTSSDDDTSKQVMETCEQ